MRSSIYYRIQKKKTKFSFWQQLLKYDYLEQAVAVRSAIKKHTEVPAPSLCHFLLADNLMIGAKITARQTLSPQISVNTGMILCIDDLILSLMANDNFFITDKVLHKGNTVVIPDYEAQRYWDYSELLNKNSIHSLSYLLPEKQPRLSQASFLSSLALRWVIAHEAAHWLLGHCAVSSEHGLDEYSHHLINLASVSHSEPLTNNEKKCFELQADGLAFELMLHYAVFDNGDDPLWKITHTDNKASDIETIIYKIRSMISASACVILLVERARILSFGLQESAYPKPITRLTNLLASAIRILSDYCGTTKALDNDHLVIDSSLYRERQSEFNVLSQALSLSLLDIDIIAGFLNVNNSLFNDTSINLWQDFKQFSDISQSMVFMTNLQAYMTGRESHTNMSTEQQQSFLEYRQLHPVQTELNKMLREYSLVEL